MNNYEALMSAVQKLKATQAARYGTIEPEPIKAIIKITRSLKGCFWAVKDPVDGHTFHGTGINWSSAEGQAQAKAREFEAIYRK